MDGVQEEAGAFEGPDQRAKLVGTPSVGPMSFRTFGEYGPMYEVLAIEGEQVRIWLYNSWEKTTIRLADALEDTQAH